MRSSRFVRWLAVASVFSASPRALASGSDWFQPAGPQFRVNASTSYDQTWVRVAVSGDGARVAFSFQGGQDPLARQFTLAGAPLTGDLACNPSLNNGIQDENECALSVDGNQLIAWSDRAGYDGEQMGIFARIFASSGAPLGAEFQINQLWSASQWRPLIAARPGGGWAVAWSGNWDGDAYFRLLDSSGAFLTGDVRVNTFTNGGQTDTALAIAPDGEMLLVFVDYSGHAGLGTGTNLWCRTFDANGAPLQVSESPVTTPAFAVLDQREPRVAADGLGRFVVVWESLSVDGSSWAVVGRRFAHDGTPLGPEFVVNTSTVDQQRDPRVAADALGNFVVVWEDWSAGDADIRARRYDVDGNAVSGEVVVNEDTVGDQRKPSVAIASDTGDVVFCWQGPGVLSDVFARVFSMYEPPSTYCTAKVNSLGCTPQIATSGSPSLSGADDFHVRASSVLSNTNGLLFFGSTPAAVPYFGGTLCVQAPHVRTPLQNAGGNPPPVDCSGAYDFFFSHAFLAADGLGPGSRVCAQYWSRDPGWMSPASNVGFTDAVVFDVRP